MTDIQPAPGSETRAARNIVESLGLRPTPGLMVVASQVVKSVRRRRGEDKVIDGVQLAREVAREVVTNSGPRTRVEICLENDRLRCVRLATNPEMPTNPSVEDLCEYVVLKYAHEIAAVEVGALDGIREGVRRVIEDYNL